MVRSKCINMDASTSYVCRFWKIIQTLQRTQNDIFSKRRVLYIFAVMYECAGWLLLCRGTRSINVKKNSAFYFVRLSLSNSISIPWARVGYLDKLSGQWWKPFEKWTAKWYYCKVVIDGFPYIVKFTRLSLSIKKMVVIVGVSINIHKSPLSMIVSGTNFIVWKYCYFADQEVLTCASKLYLYFGFKAISHIVNIKHTPFAVTSMHLIFLLLAREVIWRGNKPGVITYVGNNILLQDSTKWIF